MNTEDLEAARAVAFRYIGYAARSRSELEKRLEREEYASDVIQAVIAECQGAETTIVNLADMEEEDDEDEI